LRAARRGASDRDRPPWLVQPLSVAASLRRDDRERDDGEAFSRAASIA
jgi:hypothetical protein